MEKNTPGGAREWLAQRLRLTPDDRFVVYQSLAASSTLRDPTFWAEIVLSAGIATLGLALNSPAVIIGAMLISPLMGPIMAAGLALAVADFSLAVRAALSIALSSATAIAFSTVLVALLPFREMTSEIAARTHPNTLDLGIALLSGAVGALAVSKSVKGIATSLPGVAIAVALMPPLCVTGYGIAVLVTLDRDQGLAIMQGGSLLFVTNLVAITVASMAVFLLLHLDAAAVRSRIRDSRVGGTERPRGHLGRLVPERLARLGAVPARILIGLAMLATVFVPLKRSFDQLSAEIHYRQSLNRAEKLSSRLFEEMFGETAAGRPRSYVDSLEAAEHDGVLAIAIRAFVSDSITAQERLAFERRLAAGLGRRPGNTRVSIVEIPTSQFTIAKGKPDLPQPPPPESIGSRMTRSAREAIGALAATRLPPSMEFIDAALSFDGSDTRGTITYTGESEAGEDVRALLEWQARERLDLPDLQLTLQRIPSTLEVRFGGRAVALSANDAAEVKSLAEQLRLHTSLMTQLVSSSSDPLAPRRAAAIASEFEACGVESGRIAMSEEETKEGGVVKILVASARKR